MEVVIAAGREMVAMTAAAYHQWHGSVERLPYRWLNPAVPLPGRPTLLLHGTYGDPSNWLPFIRKVATTPAKGGIYTPKFGGIDHGMERLTLLLDQLEGEVNLVGHSSGGLVAARYAEANPGRVHTLCLIGTRIKETGNWWKDRPAFLYRDVASSLGDIEVEGNPHVYLFKASHDWLVPRKAITFPDATRFIIGGVSHLGMLSSPQLHRHLIEVLWGADCHCPTHGLC